MKKILKKTTILTFICIFLFVPICFADDFLEEIENTDCLETTTEISKEPVISSRNVLALDRKTLSVLYEKNGYDKVPMASTTKIMTCIIALETTDLNNIVKVSSNAANINGSKLGLTENSEITMLDLLYGLMLRSGNDCAISIAEYISGSVEEFANLMNKKAEELELYNTHFVTPHGLDDNNHYTTAYELAILTNYALENDIFRQIVSSKSCIITLNNTPTSINNTNELLGNLDGVYGVKTGFTFNAGRCLVSSCKRDSLDIIVVVLGSDTKKIRTLDSRNLINYIFANFEYFNTYSLIEANFKEYQKSFSKSCILEKTTEIPILEFKQAENYSFPLTKNDILNLNTKIYTITNFSPHITKNIKVGYITLFCQDKIILSLDITLKNNLTPCTWSFYFKKIIKNYFRSILSI